MMKKIGTLWFIPAVSVLAVSALLSSCGGKETASAPPAPAAEIASSSAPAVASPGTVTFLCGTVTMTVDGAENALDIGGGVPVGASIKTDKDAICEIQFADFGSVHIDSSSTLVVAKFLSDGSHTESEMALSAGKVVCKVKKLTGDDSFQVRTSEMVCGVRGTVFQVAREENQPVRVAVKEGAVAVYPPSVNDVEDLPASVSTAVYESAPVVAAGEEAAVEPEAMQALDESLQKIAEVARSQPEESAEKTVAEYKKLSVSTVEERKPVSAAAVETFTAAQNLTLEVPKETAPAKVPVSVTVEPANAIITLNGGSRFTGSFSGLYASGETLSLSISADGFVASSDTIVVASGNPVSKTIALEKVAASEPVAQVVSTPTPVATPAPPEPPKPKAVSYAVSASKIVSLASGASNAAIACDSRSGLYALKADGAVAWSVKTANGSNSVNLPAVGNGVVAFSGDKSLVVLDEKTGSQLWSLDLDKTNTGLYGRHPAIGKKNVFIGNDGGLSAYDLRTGTDAGTVSFANGTDMSPAYANGMLYVVSKTGVFQIINEDSLSVVKSVDTGAIQPVASAPAVSGSTVVFADRKGTVTAVDVVKGAVVWQSKLDPARSVDVFVDPVIASSTVFVYSKGNVYALSLSDGKAAAYSPCAGATGLVCPAGGLLWYGAGTELIGMSTSGAVSKRESAPASISGKPLKVGDALLVPLANGQLYSYPVGK